MVVSNVTFTFSLPHLLVVLLFSFLTSLPPITASPSRGPGYRGPDMYKDIRIRIDTDMFQKSTSSSISTIRLPWGQVRRFPSPYDVDDDVDNEYYYTNLGFGQMSVLTAHHRFKGRTLVRTAHMPVGESYGEKINTVYAASEVTCVFYIDRLGSEKYYSSSRTDEGSSDGGGEEERRRRADEEVRSWRPVSEPFSLEEEVSVMVDVDGLMCWNWFEGKEWSKQIEGSLDIWNTFVEEQIYGPEGREPYYRIYGNQPGLRSYFTR